VSVKYIKHTDYCDLPHVLGPLWHRRTLSRVSSTDGRDTILSRLPAVTPGRKLGYPPTSLLDTTPSSPAGAHDAEVVFAFTNFLPVCHTCWRGGLCYLGTVCSPSIYYDPTAVLVVLGRNHSTHRLFLIF
jgi:hypothetical protein